MNLKDFWYFTFPEDGCGGFDVSAVELHKVEVTQDEIKNMPFLKYAYSSKNEAINAFKKKLNDIEENL